MIERRSPRPLRLFWRLTGWRGFLPLFTGALFLLIGMSTPVPNEPRVELHEVERSANVDLMVIEVRVLADGWGEAPLRIVTYEWRDPESGAMRRDSDTLPAGQFDGIAVGDVIPVTLQYTVEREVVVQDEDEGWEFAPVFLGLGMLIWAILAIWLGRTGLQVLGAWRAATQGEVREALVSGRGFALSGPRGAVHITWTDAAGTEGRSLPGDGDLLPANGEVIVVYADPATGRSWWEEDL